MKNYNKINSIMYTPPKNKIFEDLFVKWVHKKYFKKTGKIVDIGSGNGENSIAFKRLGYKAIALDSDDFYFKKLKSCGVVCKKINVSQNKLPFKNNEIDFFFAKSVIEHLEKPLLFLEEVNRCLKPGGKLFILTPIWELCYKFFYDDPTHKSPFTFNGLKKALLITKFKIEGPKKIRNIPYVWRFIGTKAFDFVWFGSNNMMVIAEKINS